MGCAQPPIGANELTARQAVGILVWLAVAVTVYAALRAAGKAT